MHQPFSHQLTFSPNNFPRLHLNPTHHQIKDFKGFNFLLETFNFSFFFSLYIFRHQIKSKKPKTHVQKVSKATQNPSHQLQLPTLFTQFPSCFSSTPPKPTSKATMSPCRMPFFLLFLLILANVITSIEATSLTQVSVFIFSPQSLDLLLFFVMKIGIFIVGLFWFLIILRKMGLP